MAQTAFCAAGRREPRVAWSVLQQAGRGSPLYILAKLSKLPQKPQIIRPEMPDVVDAVLTDGNPFRSHAEGEAAEALGVIAAILQHGGMYHAGPHDLQPAAPLAHAAP